MHSNGNMWFTTVVARHITCLRPTTLLAQHRNYANIGVLVPDARDSCRLVSHRYMLIAQQNLLVFFSQKGTLALKNQALRQQT